MQMMMCESSLSAQHFPLLAFAFKEGLVPYPQIGTLRTKYSRLTESFQLFFEETYFKEFFLAWDTATNNGGRVSNAPQSELMLWRVLTFIIENIVKDEQGSILKKVEINDLEIYK